MFAKGFWGERVCNMKTQKEQLLSGQCAGFWAHQEKLQGKYDSCSEFAMTQGFFATCSKSLRLSQSISPLAVPHAWKRLTESYEAASPNCMCQCCLTMCRWLCPVSGGKKEQADRWLGEEGYGYRWQCSRGRKDVSILGGKRRQGSKILTGSLTFWTCGCWCWSVLASWVRYVLGSSAGQVAVAGAGHRYGVFWVPPTCRAHWKYCPRYAPLSSSIKKTGSVCFAVSCGAQVAPQCVSCGVPWHGCHWESAPTCLKFLEPEESRDLTGCPRFVLQPHCPQSGNCAVEAPISTDIVQVPPFFTGTAGRGKLGARNAAAAPGSWHRQSWILQTVLKRCRCEGVCACVSLRRLLKEAFGKFSVSRGCQ